MMPTPPASPTRNHSNGFAMQKYLMLTEQHEELRGNLEQIRANASYASYSTTSASSISSTPAVSPTRGSCSLFGHHSSSRHHRRSSVAGPPKTRRSSTALCTLPDESILYELAEEEQRLFDVNEGIKRALTELLNGDQAKSDRSFRTWVQCRLMDTEKELRSERRRKSSP